MCWALTAVRRDEIGANSPLSSPPYGVLCILYQSGETERKGCGLPIALWCWTVTVHGSPLGDAVFDTDTACKTETMRLRNEAVGQLVSLSLEFSLFFIFSESRGPYFERLVLSSYLMPSKCSEDAPGQQTQISGSRLSGRSLQGG